MITEIDILTSVRDTLKAEYGIPIYMDDVQENFRTPCFSLQIIVQEAPYNRVLNRWDCTLYIDYVGKDKSAKHFYQIKNQIRNLFIQGFQVKDRWVHVSTISAETAGEDKDFVQIKMDFELLQQVQEQETNYLMQNFYNRITGGKNI